MSPWKNTTFSKNIIKIVSMQKRKEKARRLAEQEVFEEKKNRLTQALVQKLVTVS